MKPAPARLFAGGRPEIEGVYVPSFYTVTYRPDGTIQAILPNTALAIPATIRKRFVLDLDQAYFPTKSIVPNTEIVHDRIFLELFRGCTRGCRFCQAGMIYRPVREKKPAALVQPGPGDGERPPAMMRSACCPCPPID
jgi:radical SAM superfamily enzyme YgiQ (UPF0313 family)